MKQPLRLILALLSLQLLACSGPLPELIDPSAGVAASCGDGRVRTDLPVGAVGFEVCDDGNIINTDYCTNACQVAACGDGIQRTDLGLGAPGYEACDDGNESNTDDCRTDCYANICGDGFAHSTDEDCDDGNQVDTDGCRNNCEEARCGDNVIQDGVEECDDGNVINEDACLSTCLLATCGDGFVRTGLETCDDGNVEDDDACLVNCLPARCGDGILRLDLTAGELGYEACDDGNQSDRDACLSDCVTARCGDEIIRQDLDEGMDGYEDCDDGNISDTDDCLDNCQAARCGDSVVRQDLNEAAAGFEDCDDGNDINDDDCSNDCLANVCGNGRVDVGEECDDGNDNNSDNCVEGCLNARCGDGFLRAGGAEECDDGNDLDLDPCSNCIIYPDGSSAQTPARNCADHKLHYPDATNGPLFATKPNGDVFQSYCDFTTDPENGPWTRCLAMGPGAGGYERNRFSDCRNWIADKVLFKVYRTSHTASESLENVQPSELVRLSPAEAGDAINDLFNFTNGETNRWGLNSAAYGVTDLGGTFPVRNHDGRVYADWNGVAHCTGVDFPIRIDPLGLRAELCIGGSQIPYPDAYLTCPHNDTEQLFCVSSTSYHANQGLSFGGVNQGAWTFTIFVNEMDVECEGGC